METVVFVLMILVCFNFMLKQTYRKLRSVLVISVICALFVGLMWPYAIEQSKTQIADWLVLGCTVDEAVARLDKYLDDAYIARVPQVRIVHGKGTGALRNGVTAYLRGVPYIKSFRLGEIGEGDAGVTIVDFK